MSEQKAKAALDRNLLFGVMAVQLKFITPEQLAAAGSIWAVDSSADLGEILVQQGGLTEDQRQAIEGVIKLKVQQDRDESAALKSLGGDRAVHESFAASLQVNDQVVTSSLQSFGGEVEPKRARDGLIIGELLDDSASITIEHPGRYTIKSEQGRGGIGRVMLAFDEHIGREVALKELLSSSLGSGVSFGQTPLQITAAATARFLREARITGQLEHPGIVPVYEVGRRPDNSIYYTMKLVRGKTLSDRLADCHSLTERLRYLSHFLDLCQTMAYAHSKGVIHRDLKPQNVMVGEFGETVVLDWGLAKVRGIEDVRAEALEEGLRLIKTADAGQTVNGKPIGTPSYMPPEQADGRIDEIDERSDVWSLGAVLYEILTGYPPFLGETAYEVLGKVLAEPIRPATELEPTAPPDLWAIARKCLERNRLLRYKDAAELAEDVARFSSGGLVSAYDYSMTALAMRWVKKRWPVVSTAAVALAVLLVFGAWSFVRIRAERNLALEQKKLALEQKAVALRNLSEAYFHQGLRAERETRFSTARLYFLEALILSDREDARSALYREAAGPIRPLLRQTLTGHTAGVTALAASPDGKLLLSASCAKMNEGVCGQGEFKLWSRDGAAFASFPGHPWRVNSLAFSPDSSSFLSASCGEVTDAGKCARGEFKLWSIKTREPMKTFVAHTGEVYAVAFAPDGKTVLSAGCGQQAGYGCYEGEIKLWSLETGEPLRSLVGHQGAVFSASFSADGKFIVSGGEDKAVKVWSVETGECLKTFTGHAGEVMAAAFSPDGKSVLSASCHETVGNKCVKGELKFWALETGALTATMLGHDGWINSVAIHPNGTLAASASCDEKDASGLCARGEIKLWSLPDGQGLATFPGHQGGVAAVLFDPSKTELVSGGGDRTVRLWSLYNPDPVKILTAHEKPVNALAFSPDGKFLATGASDATVKIWARDRAEPLHSINVPFSDYYAMAFSNDGSEVIAGGMDGNVSIWLAATGAEFKVIPAHQAAVRAVLPLPDGKTLLSASFDKTLKLWDLAAGKCLKTINAKDNMVFAAALAKDGKTALSGSMDKTATLWDLATGLELKTFTGHDGIVMAVALSPDNTTAATGSGDKTVKLWSLETGACLKTLSGHQETVNAIAFSPDGKYLLSGSGDSTLKLWALPEGKCVLTFTGHSDMVSAVAFSPDNTLVASAGLDQTLRLWPLPWPLIQKPAPDLLAPAERETGLRLQAFDLIPWVPK